MKTFKLLLPFIVAAVIVAAAVGAIQLTGAHAYLVNNGSMEPTIAVNDEIIVIPRDNYEVGDVIAYRKPNGKMIAHRVVRVTPDGYVTRGDANKYDDITAPADIRRGVIGKVVWQFPFMPKSRFGALIVGIGLIALAVALLRRTRVRRDDDNAAEPVAAESAESAVTADPAATATAG